MREREIERESELVKRRKQGKSIQPVAQFLPYITEGT